MKQKMIYLSVIILIVGGFFINSLAQDFRIRDKLPPPPPLMEKLNLTEAQKDKIEDLRFKHQEEMIDLRADLQMKMLEVRKYRSGDKIDRGKVIDMVKQINEIRNKIALARANHMMDIYDVLDNTQKKIWNENRPLGIWNRDGEGSKFRHWRNHCRWMD